MIDAVSISKARCKHHWEVIERSGAIIRSHGGLHLYKHPFAGCDRMQGRVASPLRFGGEGVLVGLLDLDRRRLASSRGRTV